LHNVARNPVAHRKMNGLLAPTNVEVAHKLARLIIDEKKRGAVGIQNLCCSLKDKSKQAISVNRCGLRACDIPKRFEHALCSNELCFQFGHTIRAGLAASTAIRGTHDALHARNSSMIHTHRSTFPVPTRMDASFPTRRHWRFPTLRFVSRRHRNVALAF
jgi:hypothetical protein